LGGVFVFCMALFGCCSLQSFFFFFFFFFYAGLSCWWNGLNALTQQHSYRHRPNFELDPFSAEQRDLSKGLGLGWDSEFHFLLKTDQDNCTQPKNLIIE
jgi:hypothetical protein